MFATPDDAETALRDTDDLVAALSARVGALTGDAAGLHSALEALEALTRASTRLGDYLRLPVTTDQLDPARGPWTGGSTGSPPAGRALAFVEPELLASPTERLDAYERSRDALAETYQAQVRRSALEAGVRGYASGEALALADHRVTTAVLGATLAARAAALFAEAYGPEVAAGWDDELADRGGSTWAGFPHLYAPFYTFRYTVGIAVALALVARLEAHADRVGR